MSSCPWLSLTALVSLILRGLLISFIELIKNPRYNFWNHKFTSLAPELERVFASVARSCMTPAGGGVYREGEMK
jgi:uncharacterized membrane protein